jgi:hypothetical protein
MIMAKVNILKEIEEATKFEAIIVPSVEYPWVWKIN